VAGAGTAVAEPGAVSTALLHIGRDSADERVLAEHICLACIAGLDIDGASMSLLTATVARETLWASDVTANLLEELQFSLGEGPCMQAATTGLVVMVSDLVHGVNRDSWPAFAAAVIERTGVRALFVVPLRWGVIHLGVLDLYRCAPGDLSPEQCRDLIAAADIAALLMLELRTEPYEADGQGDSCAPWLDSSLGSHAGIHQATGMVLNQLGIDATEALARLRAYAFSHQQLLLDVAADVVACRLIFTEEMR